MTWAHRGSGMFGCQKLRAMSLHHEKGRGESRSSQDMKKNGNPCGLRALLRKPGKEKIAIFSRFEQPPRNRSFLSLSLSLSLLCKESRRIGIFSELCLHFCLGSGRSSAQMGSVTLGSLSPTLGLSLPSVTQGDEAN